MRCRCLNSTAPGILSSHIRIYSSYSFKLPQPAPGYLQQLLCISLRSFFFSPTVCLEPWAFVKSTLRKNILSIYGRKPNMLQEAMIRTRQHEDKTKTESPRSEEKRNTLRKIDGPGGLRVLDGIDMYWHSIDILLIPYRPIEMS